MKTRNKSVLSLKANKNKNLSKIKKTKPVKNKDTGKDASYRDLHNIGRRKSTSTVVTYSLDSRLFFDVYAKFNNENLPKDRNVYNGLYNKSPSPKSKVDKKSDSPPKPSTIIPSKRQSDSLSEVDSISNEHELSKKPSKILKVSYEAKPINSDEACIPSPKLPCVSPIKSSKFKSFKKIMRTNYSNENRLISMRNCKSPETTSNDVHEIQSKPSKNETFQRLLENKTVFKKHLSRNLSENKRISNDIKSGSTLSPPGDRRLSKRLNKSVNEVKDEVKAETNRSEPPPAPEKATKHQLRARKSPGKDDDTSRDQSEALSPKRGKRIASLNAAAIINCVQNLFHETTKKSPAKSNVRRRSSKQPDDTKSPTQPQAPIETHAAELKLDKSADKSTDKSSDKALKPVRNSEEVKEKKSAAPAVVVAAAAETPSKPDHVLKKVETKSTKKLDKPTKPLDMRPAKKADDDKYAMAKPDEKPSRTRDTVGVVKLHHQPPLPLPSPLPSTETDRPVENHHSAAPHKTGADTRTNAHKHHQQQHQQPDVKTSTNNHHQAAVTPVNNQKRHHIATFFDITSQNNNNTVKQRPVPIIVANKKSRPFSLGSTDRSTDRKTCKDELVTNSLEPESRIGHQHQHSGKKAWKKHLQHHQLPMKLPEPLDEHADGTGADSLWQWEGEPVKKMIQLQLSGGIVERSCYSAIRHSRDDIVVRTMDCVMLRSSPNQEPFLAKVTVFYLDEESGKKMMTLLWYYRPEHTEQGRLAWHTDSDVYASRHLDNNSVDCIEDKAFVLPVELYSRFMAYQKRQSASTRPGLAARLIPVSGEDTVFSEPDEAKPGVAQIGDTSADMFISSLYYTINFQNSFPLEMTNSNVFVCRGLYDINQHKITRNILQTIVSPKAEPLESCESVDSAMSISSCDTEPKEAADTVPFAIDTPLSKIPIPRSNSVMESVRKSFLPPISSFQQRLPKSESGPTPPKPTSRTETTVPPPPSSAAAAAAVAAVVSAAPVVATVVSAPVATVAMPIAPITQAAAPITTTPTVPTTTASKSYPPPPPSKPILQPPPPPSTKSEVTSATCCPHQPNGHRDS